MSWNPAGKADTLHWASRTVSWGFSLLTGGQIMSRDAVCTLKHQFLNATCVSYTYSRQGYRILVLWWERDLSRCSPSRSAIRSSLNTGTHSAHTKLWAEVIYHSQSTGTGMLLLALHNKVFAPLESPVALAADGIRCLGCFLGISWEQNDWSIASPWQQPL